MARQPGIGCRTYDTFYIALPPFPAEAQDVVYKYFRNIDGEHFPRCADLS